MTVVNPMGATNPISPTKQKCRAHNRRGTQCGNYAIPGGTVCNMHGGKAPQVRNAARLRLLALIDPAIEVLGREMDSGESSADRIRAANSILDRAGYSRVTTIDIDTARDALTDRIITIMENR